jgi:hypothetical protein
MGWNIGSPPYGFVPLVEAAESKTALAFGWQGSTKRPLERFSLIRRDFQY